MRIKNHYNSMLWQFGAALHELIAQPELMDRAGNRVYGLP